MLHTATDPHIRLPWIPAPQRRVPPPGPLTQNQCPALSIGEAYGHFLQVFLWTHFGTFTSREARNREQLVRQFVNQFVRRLSHMAQRGIAWFYAIEFDGATRHVPHLHCLLGYTEHLTVDQIRSAWHGGFTHVSRYEPGLGAPLYVAKRLSLDPDGYGWSKRMPARIHVPGWGAPEAS